MITLLASVIAISVGQQTAASLPPSSAQAPVRPAATLYGQMSRMPSKRFYLIDKQERLDRVWARHSGEDGYYSKNPAPRIYEGETMALLIFTGPGFNSNGVNVTAVDDLGEQVRVRFTEFSFQTAGPDGGGVHCNPWGLIVLPVTEKPIVIERDVNNIIGDDPEWKQETILTRGKKMEEGTTSFGGLPLPIDPPQ